MAAIQKGINKLLPFTDPTTPIWRDILHSVVLCTFLYFAPQIQWQKLIDLAKGKVTTEHEGRGQAETEPPVEPRQHLNNDAEADAQEADEDQADDEEEPQEGRQALFNLDPAQALGLDDDNGGEGPADPQQHQPRPRDPSRAVGAKKAKSIARRDRVRAYNEFLRSQGEAQRAQDAEGAEEREMELKAERIRREKAERKIEEAKIKERVKRKEQLEAERAKEEDDRRKVRQMVTSAFNEGRMAVSLQSLAKEVKRSTDWVADLLKREGVLGKKTDSSSGRQTTTLTMITQSGWLVRIDEMIMRNIYAKAEQQCNDEDSDGKLSWQDMGKLLAQELTAR